MRTMIDLPIDCQQALIEPLMQQIYQVESSYNPFAIGVVDGRLARQPKHVEEAVATVENLQALGHNFSIGQGQINKIHFERLGWSDNIKAGFDVCTNVLAAQEIYTDCFNRSLSAGYENSPEAEYNATHAALSCYYSGSFGAGKSNPDVTRYINDVLTATPQPNASTAQPSSLAIPLASGANNTPKKIKSTPTPKPKETLFSSNSEVVFFD